MAMPCRCILDDVEVDFIMDMPYRCILDAVEIDWDEDDDVSSTTVLIRHWKFDESKGTITAVGSSKCGVSLSDVEDGGEGVAYGVETHLTELGVQQRSHGYRWMIDGLIKYIDEQIIPNLSPLFYKMTMDIVEATRAVAGGVIQEALDQYLMNKGETDIEEMMQKLQTCGAEETEELSCMICMEEGNEEEAGFALMPCKHLFHVRCVARWFIINQLCPLYRRYSKPERGFYFTRVCFTPSDFKSR